MSKAEEFLEIYGNIEQLLRSKSGAAEYVEMSAILNDLAKKDAIVASIEREFRAYMPLRNAIAHRYSHVPIADPREDTIAAMRKILDALNNPPTVRKIMTANPRTYPTTMPLKAAFEEMSSEGYTSVPVYDDGALLGVLTERTVVKWIAGVIDSDGVLAIEALTVADIQDVLTSVDGDGFDVFDFVSAHENIFAVREKFGEAIAKGKRLNAIFVTHSGKRTEKLLGIITAWDLAKVDN